MNFIQTTLSFLKNLFINKNDVKLLESPNETIGKQHNPNFINSLKVDVNKKKNCVETLTCVGDGLGIQKYTL